MENYTPLFNELRGNTPEKYVWLSLSAYLLGCSDRILDGNNAPLDKRVLIPTPQNEQEWEWIRKAAAICYARGYRPVYMLGKVLTRAPDLQQIGEDWNKRRERRGKVQMVPCPEDVDSSYEEHQPGVENIRNFWGV